MHRDVWSNFVSSSSGGVGRATCLKLGHVALAVAVMTLGLLLPHRCIPIGTVMILIAHQYSAAPLMLNHHGLGELAAAIVMNVLLPHFAAITQSDRYSNWVPFHPDLAILVIPAALLKFGLFIVLNMADRRSDWLGDKLTLPVIIGEELCCKLLCVTVLLAYMSVLGLALFELCDWTTSLLLLCTAPSAYRATKPFSAGRNRPYRLDALIPGWLRVAPAPVIAVFSHCIIIAVIRAISSRITFDNLLAAMPMQFLRVVPMFPFIYNFLVLSPRPDCSASAKPTTLPPPPVDKIIVVGGGVGGVVLALALRAMRLPFVVIERSNEFNDGGADLGLWPGAIKALHTLGLNDANFWKTKTYRVRTVYITDSRSSDRLPEIILKKLDMDTVTGAHSHGFRLVSRKPLMQRLQGLLDDNEMINNFTVEAITEDILAGVATVCGTNGVTVKGRVVIGADGLRSVCREHVAGILQEPLRYCGEICYRGLVDLRKESGVPARVVKAYLENERARPDSMTIAYGNGIRCDMG